MVVLDVRSRKKRKEAEKKEEEKLKLETTDDMLEDTSWSPAITEKTRGVQI